MEKKRHAEAVSLSTEEVLKEINTTVTKETIRRHKAKKYHNSEIYKLSNDIQVKQGDSNRETTMPPDLATLKSLIQTIVRKELKRIQKD